MFAKEQIIQTGIVEELKKSYLDYSMSVIVARALPDVRDGLKPVHRRILYAMNELGLLPNRPHKKSARLVGEVLGKYHPHGDSSVYEAMVRMAQDWTLRYPLVDGQGNFGSIDNDPAAAMRYTETRLDKLALYTLRDIDKDTVDFIPNFDDSLQEPSVLPSVLPTLLVNGASGIAVGMATNIPPHNLREIVAGLKAYIENPHITNEELLQYVPAPDFPTGGIIFGYQGVKEAYLTGRGKIKVRARVKIEENRKSGKQSIIITEMPYQVNKAALIEKISDLVNQKLIEGISGLRDESDRDGIRVVIEIKRDATTDVVLNNLYKHTQMQVTFGVIMLALVKQRPVVLTLNQMMMYFIEHRNEVVVRRTLFELRAAEKRAHILQGLLIALDNIDEVIKVIRASRDTNVASINLQERFALSEMQAKAILEMRLQRLTGLERAKLQAEYDELIEKIKEFKAILASKELQLNIISDELDEISEKFGDARRTEIVRDDHEYNVEDYIADEEVIVSISHKGFIKRTAMTNYRRQRKGGRGISGSGTYNDDFVEVVFQASTHHYLLCFTDKGRVYRIKVYDIPEGSRNAKGRAMPNVISMQQDERVTSYLSVKEYDNEHFVLMATKQGTIKKVELNSFANVRSTGIIAINLTDDDSLIATHLTDGKCDVILGSKKGLACRFRETDVRPMGRTAAGVRGISLANDDAVISMIVIDRSDTQVIVVGEKGYGKRTKYEDFRLTKRGAKGVISMNITNKTGNIIGLLSTTDTEDLVVMTTNGILIRQAVEDIRTIGRNTQGVRLIRLDDGDTIADITTVTRETEDERLIGDDDEEGYIHDPNEGLQETILE
ncbi:MAG: DNA gyrase subunit A [bacterium]